MKSPPDFRPGGLWRNRHGPLYRLFLQSWQPCHDSPLKIIQPAVRFPRHEIAKSNGTPGIVPPAVFLSVYDWIRCFSSQSTSCTSCIRIVFQPIQHGYPFVQHVVQERSDPVRPEIPVARPDIDALDFDRGHLSPVIQLHLLVQRGIAGDFADGFDGSSSSMPVTEKPDSIMDKTNVAVPTFRWWHIPTYWNPHDDVEPAVFLRIGMGLIPPVLDDAAKRSWRGRLFRGYAAR